MRYIIQSDSLLSRGLGGEKSQKSHLQRRATETDRESGDSYYRAVLQNLFFATLNTEIGKRDFSKGGQRRHRDFSKYRYRGKMADPDALRDMFAKTPFINGGLFDCLDSVEATRDGGYRIDCFGDSAWDEISVPNRLFFGKGGLIPLFEGYKFTVEENTPTETEVALDPELLGKAFENPLAANTPETRESARKQTGSYYTPRPVVDYMVDEALTAAISRKASPTPTATGDADADAANMDDSDKKFQNRLRRLFDYADPFEDSPFDDAERAAVIRAVSQVKILDPAVGSGAFPMGVLHKLTLALRRLDPDNKLWEAEQKRLAQSRAAAAFDVEDRKARDAELAEISETFERYRDSDYGRKLYLAQNSVFGADIQPIATQIAKLRFFISLAIEQTPNEEPSENYGIKPLPNLETRFVAANTLAGLESNAQMTLGQTDAVKRLQGELNDNRERHFHATSRSRKMAYRRNDRRLRRELARELRRADFSAADAQRIAGWDPYDQNASSDWFDPRYMFGVPNGFDVVIGNPPYIQLQRDGGKLGRLYKDAGYQTFARTGDIYYLFYERGVKLAKQGTGHLCLITSNQWMRVDSGLALRKFIESRNPVRLVNLGASFFDSVTVNTCVLMVNNSANQDMLLAADVRESAQSFPPIEFTTMRPANGETWIILSDPEKRVKEKMETVGTPLKDWDVKINYGIKTGYNAAFIIDDATKQTLVLEAPSSAEIIKPVLRGRDVQRYRAQQAGLWIIDTHNGYGDFPAVNIGEYPAVKSHLDGFYPALQRR